MAETCRYRRTNKLRSLDSWVLTDLPTLICLKHNGDDKREDCQRQSRPRPPISKLYCCNVNIYFTIRLTKHMYMFSLPYCYL
jgi:hypothetical protein